MKAQTNLGILQNKTQRALRKAMTDAERCLWRHLRGRQMRACKFRRQHPFADYIVDFVCLERRIVVEADGGQHQENQQDVLRDQFLQQAGFRVLRFWNHEILNKTAAVLEVIYAACGEEAPSAGDPPSPPQPVQSQTSLARPSP